jgi:branched-chain amino acid aminotransferase
MERVVWWNGKIIPERQARISIYDSSLMFGDCVFEMTRSFNAVQFKLREHLERLFKSAKHVQIDIGMTIEELEGACATIQEANKFNTDDEHRLMINVTRGTLPMYSETNKHKGTNVIIADFPLRWTVAGMGKLFEDGINAVTPSQRAIPAHLLEPKVKNRSRMHYLMANIEVSKYEGKNNWPLLLDTHGYIAEGTGCNFFAVAGNVPITPHAKDILNGISRQYIFEMIPSGQADMNVFDVISDAQEAFVTATPFCMLPVTSINGRPIGDGKVGPFYKALLDKWSENVGVDIKGQIQSWDKGVKEGPSAYKFK